MNKTKLESILNKPSHKAMLITVNYVYEQRTKWRHASSLIIVLTRFFSQLITDNREDQLDVDSLRMMIELYESAKILPPPKLTMNEQGMLRASWKLSSTVGKIIILFDSVNGCTKREIKAA